MTRRAVPAATRATGAPSEATERLSDAPTWGNMPEGAGGPHGAVHVPHARELSEAAAFDLAEFVHALRQDWDLPGIRAAISRARTVAGPLELAAALCDLASDLQQRTPARLTKYAIERRPLNRRGSGGPRSPKCPEHPSQPAGRCAACSAAAVPAPNNLRALIDQHRTSHNGRNHQ